MRLPLRIFIEKKIKFEDFVRLHVSQDKSKNFEESLIDTIKESSSNSDISKQGARKNGISELGQIRI